MLRFITVIFIIISAATSIRAQKKDIEVTFERDRNNKGAYIFYCESQLEGKTKVTVDFKILDNLRIVGGHNPYITTVSKGKRRLFRLKPRMENRGTNFRYTTSWIPGCSKTKVKKDITYLIPFLPNKEITTTGVHYLGKEFNQEAPENFHSIGFKTTPGDTICAARKGIVIDLNNSSSIGKDRIVKYRRDKNYIIIQHEDCTMARYSDLGSQALVSIGDEVFPGQPIATTDTTDYITGDHIKFSIYYPYKSEIIKNGQPTGKFYHVAHVNPEFLTENGKIQLENNQKYLTIQNEEVIKKEMSKKEKKKWDKGELYD